MCLEVGCVLTILILSWSLVGSRGLVEVVLSVEELLFGICCFLVIDSFLVLYGMF